MFLVACAKYLKIIPYFFFIFKLYRPATSPWPYYILHTTFSAVIFQIKQTPNTFFI
jgi:hypothetical protein